MAGKKERGLWELYGKDSEKADAEIWNRKPDPLSRRGFLKKTGLVTMVLAIGSKIPFFRNMPSGFIPLAVADAKEKKILKGKEGLIVLKIDLLMQNLPRIYWMMNSRQRKIIL